MARSFPRGAAPALGPGGEIRGQLVEAPHPCPGDTDGDRDVDQDDLDLALFYFGFTCT